MKIKDFYPNINIDVEIKGITAYSKKVRPNYIFVAIKGKKHDGNKYIKEAIENGASFIVSSHAHFNSQFIYTPNPKLEYIRLLKKYYSYNPKLYTVGITGTDGKTTSSTILYSILNEINPSAYIGTNGIHFLSNNIPLKNTTPSPEVFYSANKEFNDHKIHDLVMEVSSEGILDQRTEGIAYDGAIFTNLSHEHFNTHKNMNNYFLCKAKLFEKLNSSSLLVINADDPYSKKIPNHSKAKIITYGFKEADYKVGKYKMLPKGSTFEVYYKGEFLSNFHIYLFGKYNIYNALGAIAYAYELGIPLKIIQNGLHKIHSISGRFMVYKKNEISYIIDYAHTPNALKSLIENVKEFAKGRIIIVCGAAGEKDPTKRSSIGQIVTEMTDITIFTSEDPKNESLFQIFYDLTKNVKKDYYLTISRHDAINLAKRIAKSGDIVLITGKGNEKTEIIKNYVFHKSDAEILKEALDS